MTQDDLITTANEGEVKARIYNNTCVDQKYLKSKRLLNIKNSSYKEQSKADTFAQIL